MALFLYGLGNEPGDDTLGVDKLGSTEEGVVSELSVGFSQSPGGRGGMTSFGEEQEILLPLIVKIVISKRVLNIDCIFI